MRDQELLSNRALLKASFLIIPTLLLTAAVAPAAGAVQTATKAAAKPKAKVAEVLDLPNGHVGQRYETKILGIKGVDVGDASCAVVPELPAGLELDCQTMTISGRPEDAIEAAPVRITVSDSTGDSVTIDFNLTVIDGPDVVRIGGGRAAAAVPVAAPTPKGAASGRGTLVAKAPMAVPAAPAPASSSTRENRPVSAARVERVTAVAPVLRSATVPSPVAAATASSAASEESDRKDEKDREGTEVNDAATPIVPPLITSDVTVDATVISGMATTPGKDEKIDVAVVSDDGFEDIIDTAKDDLVSGCLSSAEAQKLSARFLPLAQTSGSVLSEIDDKGKFSVTLKSPLVEGQRFHVAQILPESRQKGDSKPDAASCMTKVRVAKSPLDWGRIHADFAAGVLISNDSSNSAAGATGAGSGNFSQAHQFYALSVEKSWSLPGCYIRVFNRPHNAEDKDGKTKVGADGKPLSVVTDQCYDWKNRQLEDAHKWQHLWPGFNTYFQTRLTAIPVTTVSSKNTTTTSNAAAAALHGANAVVTPAATPAATTASDPVSNLISTAQTAKVEVGVYLPFFVTRWEYNNRPNALFIAPLGKVGFDTVTGPSTVNVLAPNGTIQSQTFEQVYNYWSYGARIGHMELSRSESKAPETFSYLDIAIGPYNSLQSYICHARPAGNTSTASPTCSVYPELDGDGVDSRKRLYRFDIEGLLKIPRTAFYVGLNANIGQKTLGADHIDGGFAAPDDLRFFFGTKFDIASVLAKYNLGPH